MNETIYKKNFKDMHNSIGIISYESFCLELPSQAHSFPL